MITSNIRVAYLNFQFWCTHKCLRIAPEVGRDVFGGRRLPVRACHTEPAQFHTITIIVHTTGSDVHTTIVFGFAKVDNRFRYEKWLQGGSIGFEFARVGEWEDKGGA